MNKNFMNRLTMLAVTLMASMACFAQGKGGEATGWTAAQFGPNYQELSYSVTTNSIYHEAIVTGFASYVVDDPAIMDDPEAHAPGDVNLAIEKNTIIINHYMEGGTSHDVYIPSIAENAFAEVGATLASKIKKIKIDFKENSESEDYTQNKPVVIGSSAFAGLTSVDTVFCFTPGEFVKDILTDVFAANVYSTATLVVPDGAMGKYNVLPGWQKFMKIQDQAGNVLGDLNGDGAVKNKDYKTLLGMTGLSEGQAGFSPNADLNGDGKISNKDIKLMLAKIN